MASQAVPVVDTPVTGRPVVMFPEVLRVDITAATALSVAEAAEVLATEAPDRQATEAPVQPFTHQATVVLAQLSSPVTVALAAT